MFNILYFQTQSPFPLRRKRSLCLALGWSHLLLKQPLWKLIFISAFVSWWVDLFPDYFFFFCPRLLHIFACLTLKFPPKLYVHRLVGFAALHWFRHRNFWRFAHVKIQNKMLVWGLCTNPLPCLRLTACSKGIISPAGWKIFSNFILCLCVS